MADPLSLKLRALHDWFAGYAKSGVTMEGVGVVVTMELLDGFCAEALDLERDRVESRVSAEATEAVPAAIALDAVKIGQQLRELSGVLTNARTRQVTDAAIRTIGECALEFASALEKFARDVRPASAVAGCDADMARRADAIAAGLRSGKVARLLRPIRPKPQPAFSDGREGDAS